MTAWLRYCLLSTLLGLSLPALAKIQTQEIPYKAPDGTTLQGYYAYDDSIKGKRPGIVVVHEWWGLNDYAQRRARELAQLGYAALAIDMYGEGKSTTHAKDAQEMMQMASSSSETSMGRAKAGLELLKAQPQVDPERLAAIGYCYGGKVVLDMARAGMDLDGVVSFHGMLTTDTPAKKGEVKARVLVLNGGADSFTSTADIEKFKQEMDAAGVDYQIVTYPGAKHGFTNPDADKLAQENHIDIGYNAKADKKSWKKMQQFLHRIFSPRERRMSGY